MPGNLKPIDKYSIITHVCSLWIKSLETIKFYLLRMLIKKTSEYYFLKELHVYIDEVKVLHDYDSKKRH